MTRSPEHGSGRDEDDGFALRRDVVLMGLRASGKSSLGRLLATKAGAHFADLDDLVCGALDAADAGEAFAQLGEARFRSEETVQLRRWLEAGETRAERQPRVLALGGGTPMSPGAASALRAAASSGKVIVYLHAPPGVLAGRLRSGGVSGNRPSLTGADPAEEMEAVYRARHPVYAELATITVDGDVATESRALGRLLACLRREI